MECFFKNYQYTFLALSSISTLLAVFVALYFGYKAYIAHRPKIEASIECLRHSPTGEKKLVVRITNIGAMPIEIGDGFLTFRFPFRKSGYWVSTLEINEPYPLTINPNQTKIFIGSITYLNDLLREVPDFKKRFLNGYIRINSEQRKITPEKNFLKAIRGGEQ